MNSEDFARDVFNVLFNIRQQSKGDYLLSEVDQVLRLLNEGSDEKITMEKLQLLLQNFPLKQKVKLGDGIEPFDYRLDFDNKFTHVGLIDRAYYHKSEWI